MVDAAEKEELFARIAAARRDGRENRSAEDTAKYSAHLSPAARQAALRRPVKGRKPSLLHVWRVQCPNNQHLSTLVTSPIKPKHCPVCGLESFLVEELETV